jgi:Fic family protein
MKRNETPKFELWIPSYESDVVNDIIELEGLRAYRAAGSTPAWLFSQLKSIFHAAESLMSLRLEGNNTEIIEYAQAILDNNLKKEPIREINNYEKALQHTIEHINNNGEIDDELICELHEIVVEGLTPVQAGGDGDAHPGQYSFVKEEGLRRVGNKATGNYHYPSVHPANVRYMGRLFEFIEETHGVKYDAIKIAQVHQHFAWIHPFNNGNGRVGRLLTYAMLMKAGFSVEGLMTPSSIFCTDREEYNQRLSACDRLDDIEAQQAWLAYVFKGIIREFTKVRQLMDFDFVQKSILAAAIKGGYENGKIEDHHYNILMYVYHLKTFKKKDTQEYKVSESYRSRIIGEMSEAGLIKPIKKGGRIYQVNYLHPQLMFGILKALQYQEMLPTADQRLAQAVEKNRSNN